MHPVVTLLKIPCHVRHTEPSGRDEYGDITTAYFETDSKCYLAQRQRSEIAETEVARETWSCYLPPDVALSAFDTVEVEGLVFQVIGQPWRVFDPVVGRHSHIEATLERRE